MNCQVNKDMLLVLFVSALTLLGKGYAMPTPTTCQVPSDLNIRFQTLNQTAGMFGKVEQSQNSVVPNDEILEAAGSETLYGGTECPIQIPSGHYPLYARSTCPWYLKVDHDPYRYPTAIYQARCRCTGCIGSGSTFGCEVIYSNIKVLTRAACVDGLYQYVEDVITVSVGCTCALKASQVADAIIDTDSGPPGMQ